MISGDWNGDDLDTLAVFRSSNGVFYVKNHNSPGIADFVVDVGYLENVVTIGR